MTSKIEKERKTKGEIREKISPPLDPSVVSAGGRGPPVACPFSCYTIWVPVVPPGARSTVVKVLETSWWVWVHPGGLTIPLCRVDFSLAQVCNFLAYVASQRETQDSIPPPQGSACLPQSCIK